MPPGISSARFFALTRYTLPTAFKGLRETLAAFPPPCSLGPQAGSLTRCSRESAAASAARPPLPVLQPGGSLHACLDRSITGTPTTPARAQRPCPGPPARTVPGGQSLGSVTAPAGWKGQPTGAGRPERTAGPPRPPELPPARLPGHSHSSARWAVLFLSCLIPNGAGSTGVELREQEIGEGGGEEQPGSDASRSELKTQSRRPTAGRKSGLRGPRGTARNTPPTKLHSASLSPLAAQPSPLPSGTLRSPGRRAPACVGGRGPAGPAKSWRESLMSCAAH